MNALVSTALTWGLARLKERSTWVGIVSLVSGVGIALHPALADLIATTGAILAGAVLAVTQDHKPVAEAAIEAVEAEVPAVQQYVANTAAAPSGS